MEDDSLEHRSWPPKRFDLLVVLDPADVAALDHQRTGGNSNDEGHLFEELVTVVRFVELAESWVRLGAQGFGGKVARQIWGPVDDVALLHADLSETYIQARHGDSVRWGRGDTSLRAAHGRFTTLARERKRPCTFELAIKASCPTKGALKNGQDGFERALVRDYIDFSLPYGVTADRQFFERITFLAARSDRWCVNNAVIAVQSSIRSLLFDELSPGATVRTLMAVCAIQAPTSFPRFEYRLSDEVETFELLAKMMPLNFVPNANVVEVSDHAGVTVRIALDDAHQLRVFADWLSNARPQTVINLRQAWRKHIGT